MDFLFPSYRPVFRPSYRPVFGSSPVRKANPFVDNFWGADELESDPFSFFGRPRRAKARSGSQWDDRTSFPHVSAPKQASDPGADVVLEKAARLFQRLYRGHMVRRSDILGKLRQLRDIEEVELPLVLEKYVAVAAVFVEDASEYIADKWKFELLGYEESLLSLMMKLDAIETGGVASVRARRRSIIRRIDGILTKLDTARERQQALKGELGDAIADPETSERDDDGSSFNEVCTDLDESESEL